MKIKMMLCIFSTSLLLSGCSSLSPKIEKEPVENTAHLVIGHSLEVENTNSRLVLVDNNSTLAADGLYYASWGMGDAAPYENNEEKTVDLYDANLYLLLGESKDPASAQNNMEKWYEAAKTNYEIRKEEEITCNNETYTLLTYNCISEDNPYDRGVSAFGAVNSSAVCIELTCMEDFDEDLISLLTTFLNNCTFTHE